MGSLRSILVSFFTGAVFASAWVILIDGIINANKVPSAPFMWYFTIPAILATVTNVLMNLVSAGQLNGRGGMFDEGASTKVRVWFFITVSATLCCMGGALWVLIANYGSGTPNAWPGVALLLQTILVTVAGFLFFFGRGKGGGYGEL